MCAQFSFKKKSDCRIPTSLPNNQPLTKKPSYPVPSIGKTSSVNRFSEPRRFIKSFRAVSASASTSPPTTAAIWSPSMFFSCEESIFLSTDSKVPSSYGSFIQFHKVLFLTVRCLHIYMYACHASIQILPNMEAFLCSIIRSAFPMIVYPFCLKTFTKSSIPDSLYLVVDGEEGILPVCSNKFSFLILHKWCGNALAFKTIICKACFVRDPFFIYCLETKTGKTSLHFPLKSLNSSQLTVI